MREVNIELSRRFINTENSNDDRILDKEKNECQCNQKKAKQRGKNKKQKQKTRQ